MNLEQAIHLRWAADSALCALLPAADVVTGRRSGATLPYATIHRRENRNRLRTNAGDAVDEAVLQIHVWHDDYDAGRAVVEQVKTTFDRCRFTLNSGDRVLEMRRTTDAAEADDEGRWQFSLEFLVQVYLSSGV